MKYLIFMLLCAVFFATQASAQIAVIANKNLSMQINSAKQVSDIYTLDLTSSGGTNLVVFDLKDEAVKGKFLSAIGKSSPDLKKIWMRAQLSGDGKAPEALATEAEVVQKVASTAGGVGYVNAAGVTGDVKVLYTTK